MLRVVLFLAEIAFSTKPCLADRAGVEHCVPHDSNFDGDYSHELENGIGLRLVHSFIRRSR
jgi:hypothetical protein